MYPATRLLDAEAEATEMEGVEHLGQYVYEMTQAKVAALKKNGGVLPPIEATVKDVDMEDGNDDGIDEEELEPEEPEDVEELE
jgi:intron-binding protein aquarius